MRIAAERLVQIAVEEVLNIGNNLISGSRLRRADSYRDIFKVLEEEKVISKKMSEELHGFVVFRNRIVHVYWKIEDDEFVKQVKKVKVLSDFVKVILKKVK